MLPHSCGEILPSPGAEDHPSQFVAETELADSVRLPEGHCVLADAIGEGWAHIRARDQTSEEGDDRVANANKSAPMLEVVRF